MPRGSRSPTQRSAPARMVNLEQLNELSRFYDLRSGLISFDEYVRVNPERIEQSGGLEVWQDHLEALGITVDNLETSLDQEFLSQAQDKLYVAFDLYHWNFRGRQLLMIFSAQGPLTYRDVLQNLWPFAMKDYSPEYQFRLQPSKDGITVIQLSYLDVQEDEQSAQAEDSGLWTPPEVNVAYMRGSQLKEWLKNNGGRGKKSELRPVSLTDKYRAYSIQETVKHVSDMRQVVRHRMSDPKRPIFENMDPKTLKAWLKQNGGAPNYDTWAAELNNPLDPNTTLRTYVPSNKGTLVELAKRRYVRFTS